jgi:peptidoglycan hydrolase-like protein with peptidoglycan-binding domain
MENIIKEQQGNWEQVPAKEAGKLEASGKYIVRKEDGKYYVMKKTSQNNPTPTPTVTTPPTPTPTPAAPPRRTPDQPQNRSNAIKLSDIKNGTKIVKIGSKGSVVTKIQELLIGLGYNDVSNSGKADAYFGPKTDAMVKKYQKDNGLKDDGIVGSKTIIALLGGKSDATKVEPAVTATQPDNIQGTDGVIIKEKEKLDILQESVKKLLRKSLLGFRKK